MGPQDEAAEVALLMDCAYQDNATRELAQRLGFVAVVPPSPKRRQPWPLDKAWSCPAFADTYALERRSPRCPRPSRPSQRHFASR